jgi:hypothetical protein
MGDDATSDDSDDGVATAPAAADAASEDANRRPTPPTPSIWRTRRAVARDGTRDDPHATVRVATGAKDRQGRMTIIDDDNAIIVVAISVTRNNDDDDDEYEYDEDGFMKEDADGEGRCFGVMAVFSPRMCRP